MPPRASRTMSRDHHSPMVSSDRATGHASALKDLCRIAPRQNIWLHHYTRFGHPIGGCISQPDWKKAGRSTPLAGAQIERSKKMTYKLNIRRITLGLLPIIGLVLGGALAAPSQTSAPRNVKNIVLIHGGFVDGSGWEDVYNALKKKGYNITIVQNPTISLVDDVAVTKRVIAAQDGPVILVGHSYGGVVITEVGTDPKVVACLCCRICA